MFRYTYDLETVTNILSLRVSANPSVREAIAKAIFTNYHGLKSAIGVHPTNTGFRDTFSLGNKFITFSSREIGAKEVKNPYGIRMDDLARPVAKVVEHMIDCKDKFNDDFIRDALTGKNSAHFVPVPGNELVNAVSLLINIHTQRASLNFREKVIYTILADQIMKIRSAEMITLQDEGNITQRQLKQRAEEAITKVINKSIPASLPESDRTAYRKMIIQGSNWGMQALRLSKYIPGAFLLPFLQKEDFKALATVANGEGEVAKVLYALVTTNTHVSAFFTQLLGFLRKIKPDLDDFVNSQGLSIPSSIMDLADPNDSLLARINDQRLIQLLPLVTGFTIGGLIQSLFSLFFILVNVIVD